MKQAMAPAEADPLKPEAAQFYMEFARIVQQFRGTDQAWRLQYLTDLSQLPDYEPGWGYEYDPRTLGAPVDDRGEPIYHRLPESFESAASDGERWRWLHARAVALDPNLKYPVDYIWAAFLHSQFGVQTMAGYEALFGGARPLDKEDEQKDQSSPYEVHTLTDRETIARLAVGMRRFDLLSITLFCCSKPCLKTAPAVMPAMPPGLWLKFMKIAGSMIALLNTGKYIKATIHPPPGSISIRLRKTGAYLNPAAFNPPAPPPRLNIASATAVL